MSEELEERHVAAGNSTEPLKSFGEFATGVLVKYFGWPSAALSLGRAATSNRRTALPDARRGRTARSDCVL